MKRLNEELQSSWSMPEIWMQCLKVWTGTFSQEHKKQSHSSVQLSKCKMSNVHIKPDNWHNLFAHKSTKYARIAPNSKPL